VQAIADVVGALVGANFYRTYNRSNTVSFGNGTCPVLSAGVVGSSTGSESAGVGATGTGTVAPSAELTV
jgi:hypothetical protein